MSVVRVKASESHCARHERARAASTEAESSSYGQ